MNLAAVARAERNKLVDELVEMQLLWRAAAHQSWEQSPGTQPQLAAPPWGSVYPQQSLLHRLHSLEAVLNIWSHLKWHLTHTVETWRLDTVLVRGDFAPRQQEVLWHVKRLQLKKKKKRKKEPGGSQSQIAVAWLFPDEATSERQVGVCSCRDWWVNLSATSCCFNLVLETTETLKLPPTPWRSQFKFINTKRQRNTEERKTARWNSKMSIPAPCVGKWCNRK